MKKNCNLNLMVVIISLLMLMPTIVFGQNEIAFVKKYLSELPSVKQSNTPVKYRMTAIYTNRDLYGKFTGKTKVTGDYTRGLPGDSMVWNNVYISNSQSFDESFPQGSKKDYMENFKYISSAKMLEESPFKNFPANPENVFARNLVWDMLAFETFSWQYYDSLKLGYHYILPDMKGEFNMAEIGNYSHNKVELCWNGVSVINGELCAVIEFNAIDNLLELSMPQIKSKGTEQYWGTIHLSLKTKNIEHAIMYSGTIQEIEIAGMKDKFLAKTIRELEVSKIQ